MVWEAQNCLIDNFCLRWMIWSGLHKKHNMQQFNDAHATDNVWNTRTYEGCFTKDTSIRINGIDCKFDYIVNTSKLVEGHNNIDYNVDTVGSTAVSASVFYGGIKECTKIEWEGGHFEGANHPIMILRDDGNLEWKLIEDLIVGDVLMYICTI